MNKQHLENDIKKIKTMWNFNEAQCNEIDTLHKLYMGIYDKIKEFGVTAPDLAAFAQWYTEVTYANNTGYMYTNARELFICVLVNRLNKNTEKTLTIAKTSASKLGYQYEDIIESIRVGDTTLLLGNTPEAMKAVRAMLKEQKQALDKKEGALRRKEMALAEQEKKLIERERKLRIRASELDSARKQLGQTQMRMRQVQPTSQPRQVEVDSYCTRGSTTSPC